MFSSRSGPAPRGLPSNPPRPASLYLRSSLSLSLGFSLVSSASSALVRLYGSSHLVPGDAIHSMKLGAERGQSIDWIRCRRRQWQLQRRPFVPRDDDATSFGQRRVSRLLVVGAVLDDGAVSPLGPVDQRSFSVFLL